MIKFDSDTHTYTVDGIRYVSVTQVLSGLGLYGDAANWFTEEGRMRGTYVHKIIAWHLAEELDDSTVDDSLRGYFDAWKQFEADTGFVPTDTEKPLANDIYLLAGTPDHIGLFNGKYAIVDVKTSATVGAAEQLQTAGYELLYKTPFNTPIKRFSLHLAKTGKYRLIEHENRQDRHIFLSCLAIYQWKKNNLKGNE